MYKKTFTAYQGDRAIGTGVSFSATNLRSLSEGTGIGYENLVRVFTRESKIIWDEAPGGWLIIKSELMKKGRGRNYITKKHMRHGTRE